MSQSVDLLDTPMYSPIFVARLVGLRPERVRRWLRGYKYRYASVLGAQPETREKRPVVHRRGAEGSSFASFLDLIDLLFVKRFVGTGLSLQRLRLALDETTELLGDHHFAQRRFWTDGHEIYLQVREKSNSLIQLLTRGQWAIAPIIQATALQIDFSEATSLAEKWFPLGRQRPIVLDPKVAFGSPSIVKRGILTSNVYDLYMAEDKNLGSVCTWMGVDEEEARTAVEFEQMLAAA